MVKILYTERTKSEKIAESEHIFCFITGVDQVICNILNTVILYRRQTSFAMCRLTISQSNSHIMLRKHVSTNGSKQKLTTDCKQM